MAFKFNSAFPWIHLPIYCTCMYAPKVGAQYATQRHGSATSEPKPLHEIFFKTRVTQTDKNNKIYCQTFNQINYSKLYTIRHEI